MRGYELLDVMTRAEINTLDSAYNLIDKYVDYEDPTKRIGAEDAKILKNAMKEYINAD